MCGCGSPGTTKKNQLPKPFRRRQVASKISDTSRQSRRIQGRQPTYKPTQPIEKKCFIVMSQFGMKPALQVSKG